LEALVDCILDVDVLVVQVHQHCFDALLQGAGGEVGARTLEHVFKRFARNHPHCVVAVVQSLQKSVVNEEAVVLTHLHYQEQLLQRRDSQDARVEPVVFVQTG